MMNLKKMMIVDDDEIFVLMAKKVIQKTNLVEVIKVFGNGLDALHFLKQNSEHPELLPEIILLDICMPIMDGWQFLDEFVKLSLRIDKKILICVCSSSISLSDIIRAKEISVVTDYIVKSVAKEEIIDFLEKLILTEEFDQR